MIDDIVLLPIRKLKLSECSDSPVARYLKINNNLFCFRGTSQKEESTTMGNENEGSKRPSTTPKKERARKVSKVDKLVNAIMESGQEGDETLRKISQKNNNEDDLFYDSCKARMNKIADEKKAWVRFKISEILYQAESTAPISQAPYSPQGTMYSNF